ncbi:DotI/IcmL/TraM family protein [Neptuniibacter halophilus]|uniref:DotI/IcmL/TraM family protein n=1 Tax=Neptuniibacter halophilus TaxID=651666 RepID=UPI002572FBCC|nr:DotI/IcmL/TraM family protein [Neptuniibacter halophilus]
MAKDNHTEKADEILKGLQRSLREDPTGGVSAFVDLLTVERFTARAIAAKALSYSLIMNVLLIALVAYLAFPRTDVKVAQQRIDGRLAEIATSEKPYYDLQDIKDFAQKRAVNIHSWTHTNYLQVFEDERPFWDESVLETYIDTLLARDTFGAAEQYRRRFEAVIPRPPKVLQQIKYDGEYRIYRVKLTLVDESIDIEGVDSKTWEITLDVREVTPDEGWAGLKVMRYDEVIKK